MLKTLLVALFVVIMALTASITHAQDPGTTPACTENMILLGTCPNTILPATVTLQICRMYYNNVESFEICLRSDDTGSLYGASDGAFRLLLFFTPTFTSPNCPPEPPGYTVASYENVTDVFLQMFTSLELYNVLQLAPYFCSYE